MKKFLLISLLILGFIPLLDLLNPGLPITHDGQDHVARVANFYQNLSEGNIVPRWAGNLNWGYGHPILMFLYPLPSYAASLFHLLGFSLIDSIKLVFGLSFILSGIFMFLWIREFLGEFPAFVGGLLYMLAPYRFVDLYVRGALGEHFAFMFVPLILYFLLKISKEKYSAFLIIGGSISLAAFILSHNAISLMFLPVILLYLLFLIFTNKKRQQLTYQYISILVIGLGISAFFWIPAYFEGKYTLRDIVTVKDYATRFVDISKFIWSNWNYGISGQFSVQVGVLNWIFILLSIPMIFILYRRKNNLWSLSLGAIIVFIAAIFLMIPQSQFIWDKITTLQKFQFPWRFLTISVFTSSIIGALVVSQLKNYRKLLTVIFIVLVLWLNKNYWHAKGYLLKDESFFTGVYNSTTDTGESSPRWSVRFMETRPKNHIEVISGNAEIKELKRTSTKHEYDINSSNATRIRENTLYFPGWEALIDGKSTNIEFQDPKNRGVMTFNVPQGAHKVYLEFKETKLRLISDLISFLSLIAMLSLWINKRFRLF